MTPSRNVQLANVFIGSFEKARDEGIDIGGLITKQLRNLLGETPTYAVIYFIGEDSLGNPSSFAAKITEIFGAGSEIILRRLLFELETFSSIRKTCVG